MKRHHFYPRPTGEQAGWLENFANALESCAATLGIAPAVAADCVADARWCAYVVGLWLATARSFSPASTDAVEAVLKGKDFAVTSLPTFSPPAPPAGVSPRPNGGLGRIFEMAGAIKRMKNYTESIGTRLGIVGPEDTGAKTMPKFTAKVFRGEGVEMVRLSFFKYGHTGVFIETRRGGGDWETMAIDTESPYDDERPLLAADTPEVREYRMCFWDKGTPNGDWTDVAKVTVSP